MLDDFERAVAARAVRAAAAAPGLERHAAALPTPSELTSAAYWRRHVREPVRFADGLQALAAQRSRRLRRDRAASDCWPSSAPRWAPMADRWSPRCAEGRDDRAEMLQSLATLYLAGVTVDWRGVEQGCGRRIVDLPTYPFQRERHWFDAAPAPAVAVRQVAPPAIRCSARACAVPAPKRCSNRA